MAITVNPDDVFRFDPAELVPGLDSFVPVVVQWPDSERRELAMVPRGEAALREGESDGQRQRRLAKLAAESQRLRRWARSLITRALTQRLAERYTHGVDALAAEAAALILPHLLEVYIHVANSTPVEQVAALLGPETRHFAPITDEHGRPGVRFVPEAFDTERMRTHLTGTVKQSLASLGGPEGLAEWTLGSALTQLLAAAERDHRARRGGTLDTQAYAAEVRARIGHPEHGISYWVTATHAEAVAALARRLVWGWDLRGRSLAELEQLLGLRAGGAPKSSAPTAPVVPFAPAHLTVSTAPHPQAAIRGMLEISNGNRAAWRRPAGGAPSYLDKDTNVEVFWGGATGAELLDAAEGKSAWDQLLTLSDDEVSTFMICLGKWFSDTGGGEKGRGKARVHAADVLSFCGATKHHKGGYRREQKEQVRDRILKLHALWVKSNSTVYEQVGRGKREKQVTIKSHLLEVAIESDRDLFGAETPYAFRIAPGDWIEHHLDDLNRMTGLLLRPVMLYDSRQGVGRMAMRLGIYLTFQWRIRAAHDTLLQPWSMGTLLHGARIPLPTDRRVLQRFRDELEKALDQLRSDGVIADWEYQRWDEAALPKKGWFAEWLKWTVTVTPPAVIPEHYGALPGERRRAVAAAKAGAARARQRATERQTAQQSLL